MNNFFFLCLFIFNFSLQVNSFQDIKDESNDKYFYISFHGGHKNKINSVRESLQHSKINNVSKYTIDGNFIGEVLYGYNVQEPRGMAIDQETGKLLLVNAYKKASSVLMFGQCNEYTDQRYYVNIFVNQSDAGLSHPYMLSFHTNSTGGTNVYISVQNTNVILRFDYPYGNPLPSPSSIQHPPYLGTFAELNDSPRGIAFDSNNRLYVCNHKRDVSIFDTITGNLIQTISIESPVGIYYDVNSNTIYIGSNGDIGYVLGYDVSSEKTRKYSSILNLQHPTGIVTYNNTLYVLCQYTRTLEAFDIPTGKYLGIIIPTFSDDPEALILSPC